MISKTFINRPKFAFVISILITLAGFIAMLLLPVNMYPQITPPQIEITAVYPGASAQVVEESVIRPIEEQVNGVEDMLYIESTASNNGTAPLPYFSKLVSTVILHKLMCKTVSRWRKILCRVK